MSEQPRDRYQRTPINGMFLQPGPGTDSFRQPEPPVAVIDESSVPVEASSTVPVEPAAIAENPVDALPAAPEFVPPTDASVVVS